MNFDQLKSFAAQGRIRFEPVGARVTDGGYFTVDGAIVTDAQDRAICARLLGLPVDTPDVPPPAESPAAMPDPPPTRPRRKKE